MNVSKFKRMLKAASAVERHLASGLDSVRALQAVLENELAAGQAIGIASAAPVKAKQSKAERTAKPAKVAASQEQPAKRKLPKVLPAVDKPAKKKKKAVAAPAHPKQQKPATAPTQPKKKKPAEATTQSKKKKLFRFPAEERSAIKQASKKRN